MMLTNDTILGIFFFCQFGIGFNGNAMLLMSHIKTFLCQPHAKKPIDLIIIHLTLTNFMTVTMSAIPEIVSFFGFRNFMGDMGCKAVLYLIRVCRGLSLCNTTFLSLFQAIKIAPSNSRWAWLKPKIPSYIFPAFFLFWIINLLLNIRVALRIGAPYNTTSLGQVFNLKYCMGTDPDKYHSSASQVALFLTDFLCVLLMICTSTYMVKLLFKHRKTVQRVHSTSLCPRPSCETKATHTILALVSCFVFFYCTSCFMNIYVSYVHTIQGMENISLFTSSCYSAFCPLLMIKNNTRATLLKYTTGKRRKSSPQTLFLRVLNILTRVSDTRLDQDRPIL